VQRSVGSAEPPAARGHFERSTGLMGGTVALVSGEGYFGITGHFGITSSNCGYLHVSVPHQATGDRRQAADGMQVMYHGGRWSGAW